MLYFLHIFLVMTTEVTCPEAHVGAVLNDIVSRRRGAVRCVISPNTHNHTSSAMSASESTVPTSQIVQADVPLAELREYASALRSATQGTGAFAMEFHDFRVVPQHVVQVLQKGMGLR